MNDAELKEHITHIHIILSEITNHLQRLEQELKKHENRIGLHPY